MEGAQQESELIRDLFYGNLYNGKELTKQDFIATAKQSKLLHLAMHAVINNEEPGLSKLLFTNEDSVYKNLYLEELYGLNLNADLAVLSACNTGVGTDLREAEYNPFNAHLLSLVYPPQWQVYGKFLIMLRKKLWYVFISI